MHVRPFSDGAISVAAPSASVVFALGSRCVFLALLSVRNSVENHNSQRRRHSCCCRGSCQNQSIMNCSLTGRLFLLRRAYAHICSFCAESREKRIYRCLDGLVLKLALGFEFIPECDGLGSGDSCRIVTGNLVV